MKPSELPKNKRVSARMNQEILDEIKRRGLSVQKILDLWANENIKIEIKTPL